jgi:hypothetical protein
VSVLNKAIMLYPKQTYQERMYFKLYQTCKPVLIKYELEVKAHLTNCQINTCQKCSNFTTLYPIIAQHIALRNKYLITM